MNERFIVKGTQIKDTSLDEYLTLREVCKVLNNQDQQLERLCDEVFDLKQLLLQCNREFRKYDGRKLITLDFVVYAEILNKISEVLDPK